MEGASITSAILRKDTSLWKLLYGILCVGMLLMLVAKPPLIAAYPWKAILSALCAASLIGIVMGRRGGEVIEMRVPRFFIVFALFVLWSVGSSLYVGSMEVARWQFLSWLSSLWIFLIAYQVMTEERQLKLSQLFVYGVLANFLMGVILTEVGLSRWFLFSHYAGSFPNKNYLAEALVIALPFSLYQGLNALGWRRRLFWMTASALVVSHAFVGGSKSGILGIGLELLVCWLMWVRLRWGIRLFSLKCGLLVGGGVTLLVGAIWYGMQTRLHGNFVGNASDMLACRVDTWKTAWLMIEDSPIWGIGSYRFVWDYPVYDLGTPGSICTSVMKHFIHAHSEPLHIWAELGLLGLGLITAGFLWVARDSWCYFGRISGELRQRFIFLFLLPVLGLLAQGIFNRPLHWTFSPFAFALLLSFLPVNLAMVVSWSRIRRIGLVLVPLYFFAFWGTALDLKSLYYREAAEYSLRQGAFSRGLKESLIAIELTPNNPDLAEVVARNYKRLGLWVEAKEYYLRTLESYPDSTATLMNLAYVEAKMNRFERAKWYLEEVRVYFPNDPKVDALAAYVEQREAEIKAASMETNGSDVSVFPAGSHESQ